MGIEDCSWKLEMIKKERDKREAHSWANETVSYQFRLFYYLFLLRKHLNLPGNTHSTHTTRPFKWNAGNKFFTPRFRIQFKYDFSRQKEFSIWNKKKKRSTGAPGALAFHIHVLVHRTCRQLRLKCMYACVCVYVRTREDCACKRNHYSCLFGERSGNMQIMKCIHETKDFLPFCLPLNVYGYSERTDTAPTETRLCDSVCTMGYGRSICRNAEKKKNSYL